MTDWILAIAVVTGVAGGLWYLWDRRQRELLYVRQVVEGAAPLPPDLQQEVDGWADEWAREEANRFVREKYAETRDWSRVRDEVV